jgi:hypothetical protein
MSDRPVTDQSMLPVAMLYIAGTGRCGTTFLDVMLGQQPGLWTAGELHLLDVWRENADRCGCGEPVPQCPFWRGVFARLDDGIVRDVGLLRRDPYPRGKAMRWRYLLGGGEERDGPAYRAANTALLRAMREEIDSRDAAPTIIDASKDVYRLSMLIGDGEGGELRIRALHVWRDPEGFVAHMIQLRKAFRPWWALRFAARWAVENRLIARALAKLPPERRTALHFDDFLNDFQNGMAKLTAFAGGSFDPSMTANTRQRINHGISGNSPRWEKVEPRKPGHTGSLGPVSRAIVRLVTRGTVARLKRQGIGR